MTPGSLPVTVTRDGAVAIVELNRPRRLNAISTDLTPALHDALASAEADDDVRAILLCGAGRAFCAGDDLKEFEEQARDAESIRAHIAGIQQITRDLLFGRTPVVCAAHGYAVGGGFEWLLNCDLVVAAADLVCFFPELQIAQFPTGAVTHLLPRAIGHQRTMELFLLGERQTAADLARLGLVNRVVDDAAVRAEALQVARRIAALAPFGVAELKRMLIDRAAIEAALAAEQRVTEETFARPDAGAAARRFREP